MTEPTHQFTSDAERQVVRLANAILNGELGITEGARKVVEIKSQVAKAGFDPDFLTFVGIESETDAFPIGTVRQLWAPEALASYDQERQNVETHYRDFAFAACRQLLKRFVSGNAGSADLPVEDSR